MATKERKHTAPPRCDEAFKAGAVRMVTEQGRPSREAAKEPGICIDTLRNWLKTAGAPSPGQADRQNRDAKRLRELEAENRAGASVELLCRLLQISRSGYCEWLHRKDSLHKQQDQTLKRQLVELHMKYLTACIT